MAFAQTDNESFAFWRGPATNNCPAARSVIHKLRGQIPQQKIQVFSVDRQNLFAL